MEQKSSTFMTLGTGLGMLIALIITFLIFLFDWFIGWVPFLFLGFGFLGRLIGYGLDRIVDRNK